MTQVQRHNYDISVGFRGVGKVQGHICDSKSELKWVRD